MIPQVNQFGTLNNIEEPGPLPAGVRKHYSELSEQISLQIKMAKLQKLQGRSH